MFVLIFLIGALLGLVLGAAMCIRYLRQELTARLGPTLDLLQLQLQNLQAGVNIALANWHAEMHENNHSRNPGRTNRELERGTPWRADATDRHPPLRHRDLVSEPGHPT